MQLILTQSELFVSLLVCQVFANSCATAVPQNSLKESPISPLEHLLWHNFLSGPGRKGKNIITKKKKFEETCSGLLPRLITNSMQMDDIYPSWEKLQLFIAIVLRSPVLCKVHFIVVGCCFIYLFLVVFFFIIYILVVVHGMCPRPVRNEKCQFFTSFYCSSTKKVGAVQICRLSCSKP